MQTYSAKFTYFTSVRDEDFQPNFLLSSLKYTQILILLHGSDTFTIIHNFFELLIVKETKKKRNSYACLIEVQMKLVGLQQKRNL